MANCRFTQGTTFYQCGACRGEENITQLVEVLTTFIVDNCPTELYHAFKVLRLGSHEFATGEREHQIIKRAITHLDPVANHTSSKHPTA